MLTILGVILLIALLPLLMNIAVFLLPIVLGIGVIAFIFACLSNPTYIIIGVGIICVILVCLGLDKMRKKGWIK